MTEAAPAPQTAARQAGPKRVIELRVSGNLMTLDSGLYCIINKASSVADARSGMPGVRLSLPPGTDSRPECVQIATFRDDGYLSGGGDAALVRITNGPAHILVTSYLAPDHPEAAPSLQVVRLLEGGGMPAVAPAQAAPLGGPAHVPAAPAQAAPEVMDMVAHIQGRGDVGAHIGDRLGEVGSKRWIEGFAIAPTRNVAPADIEYQAVLGRGWLSPWVEGGEFCGSRGMALPVLGLRVRLRGDAARDYECSYAASFTDGTQVGPVAGGESCEAESLAPLESIQLVITARGAAPAADDKPAAAKPAKPATGSRRR